MDKIINKKSGFTSILILLSVLILIVVGGSGYYFYKQQKEIKSPNPQVLLDEQTNLNSSTTKTTKTVEVHQTDTQTSDTGSIKTDINIKTDVTQVVDCGSEDCFKQKFITCQPAILKIETGLGDGEYKIIGPVTGGCQMVFKYTRANPEWDNQIMTCTFDNKVDFQTSIQNLFTKVYDGSAPCSGPLYPLINPQVGYSDPNGFIDLIITEIAEFDERDVVDSNMSVIGKKISVIVNIKNIGTKKLENSVSNNPGWSSPSPANFEVVLDGVKIFERTGIDALMPNESSYISFELSKGLNDLKNKSLNFIINNNKAVVESNYNNNMLIKSF